MEADKIKIRKEVKPLSMDPVSRSNAQNSISLKVKSLVDQYEIKQILLFFAIKSEPVLDLLFDSSFNTFYPKILDFEKKSMSFYKHSQGDAVVMNRYGINEASCLLYTSDAADE